jgi:hypothetical protein
MAESGIPQKNHQSSDEIDIFEFCSRIWKAFTYFLIHVKNFITFIIILLIRKSLWIISFAIIGAIAGYVFYGISRSVYSSVLEGSTGGIYDEKTQDYVGGVDNTVIIDHINKLNQLTDKPALLSNFLNISTDDAGSIRSIKAYYGIDVNRDMKPDYVDVNENYNPKDTNQIRVPSFLHIRVSVYEENILPALRKGLFHYINSNSYIEKLFEVDRAQKRQLIKEIETEISKIDSLQRIRYRKEARTDNGQIVVMGTEAEIKLFYPDVLKLYDRKQKLERSLVISDEIIVVVQDFTPLEYEENPVLHYMLTISATMAVLGLFCALLWQNRKRIWKLIVEDSGKK